MPQDCRTECEAWVREIWMKHQFQKVFQKRALRLEGGGKFEFDAVSDDGTIAACISTSGGTTGSGNRANAKVQKLQADMLFLLLSEVPQPLMILTETSMYELCERERKAGRVPLRIRFWQAALPEALAARLKCDQERLSKRFSVASDAATGSLGGSEAN